VPPGEAEVEQRRDRPRRNGCLPTPGVADQRPVARGERDSAVANNDADGDPPLSCVEVKSTAMPFALPRRGIIDRAHAARRYTFCT
jgi:hypothetical protein